MATLAEQMYQTASQVASAPGPVASLNQGLQQGAELGMKLEQMQNQKQQLVMAKQELEIKKSQQSAELLQKAFSIKNPRVMQAYLKNVAQPQMESMGHPLDDTVMTSMMESLKTNDEDAIALNDVLTKIVSGEDATPEMLKTMQAAYGDFGQYSEAMLKVQGIRGQMAVAKAAQNQKSNNQDRTYEGQYRDDKRKFLDDSTKVITKQNEVTKGIEEADQFLRKALAEDNKFAFTQGMTSLLKIYQSRISNYDYDIATQRSGIGKAEQFLQNFQDKPIKKTSEEALKVLALMKENELPAIELNTKAIQSQANNLAKFNQGLESYSDIMKQVNAEAIRTPKNDKKLSPDKIPQAKQMYENAPDKKKYIKEFSQWFKMTEADVKKLLESK